MNKPFSSEKTHTDRSRRVAYSVHGFWSTDSVSVYQMKEWGTDKWAAPRINWACGGRDSEQEPDNMIAAECFAKAVLAAVKVGRKWEAE